MGWASRYLLGFYRFPQRCCWGIRTSGIRCRVTGWLVLEFF